MKALKIEQLTFQIEHQTILNSINMEVVAGEIVGLIGQNGAGKTTLLRILAHILLPDTGELTVNDESLYKHPENWVQIAYLPDTYDFFKYDTPHHAIRYYKILYPQYDEDFVTAELERQGIDRHKSFRSLSKGKLTIAGLIIVLGTRAKFILLDEVLDGVDVLNREIVIRYLIDAVSYESGILISSHQLDELEALCNKAYYLTLDGEVIQQDQMNDLVKYQVVTREELPDAIRQAAVIRQSIGRVHTILVNREDRDWPAVFQESGIVQYDTLPTQLADTFYFEDRKGERHARH